MEVAVYKNFRTRGKRPMRNLSLTDKVRAIQRIHDGETKASVSRDLGVPESTLRGWCKNEQKLRFMSTQSQLLEGLADNIPEKRLAANMDNVENTTNCFKHNFIKEENNNNYKIPEFINNINMNMNMKFNSTDTSLQKFNWNLPFDQPSEYSSIAFPTNNNACTIKKEVENVVENNNLEICKDNQRTVAESGTCEDTLAQHQFSDPMSVMHWCKMFMNSINFMAMTSELNSTSSSTEPESASVLSSVCTGKRTYDDPYSELRNIYELQKGSESDDSFDDDSAMDADEEPQDLSIKSQT